MESAEEFGQQPLPAVTKVKGQCFWYIQQLVSRNYNTADCTITREDVGLTLASAALHIPVDMDSLGINSHTLALHALDQG